MPISQEKSVFEQIVPLIHQINSGRDNKRTATNFRNPHQREKRLARPRGQKRPRRDIDLDRQASKALSLMRMWRVCSRLKLSLRRLYRGDHIFFILTSRARKCFDNIAIPMRLSAPTPPRGYPTQNGGPAAHSPLADPEGTSVPVIKREGEYSGDGDGNELPQRME